MGITAGIETTTGPLGQGIANAVGMALAGKLLNKRFGDVIDHRTPRLPATACMMEGVSHEACSLAGVFPEQTGGVLRRQRHFDRWRSARLVPRQHRRTRFPRHGWHVIGPIDGHSIPAVDAAIETTKKRNREAVLIICKTDIGHGSRRTSTAPRTRTARR